MKPLILFLLSTLCTACATYTGGYMPQIQNTAKTNFFSPTDKKDVSFSTSYYQEVGDEIIISEKSFNKSVKAFFEKSNLFRHAYSIPLDNKSNYHYHFDMKITGTSPKDQEAYGMLSGFTLMVIPIWLNFYVDTTMYIFIDDKEVFSSTTTERVTDFVWLPLAAAWPFFNHATIGSKIKKRMFQYFAQEIITNKLHEYPSQKTEDKENEFSFLYD